ncbi:hypothetical protein U1Q18_001607 [Sarracenia purpurea var. burkii]
MDEDSASSLLPKSSAIARESQNPNCLEEERRRGIKKSANRKSRALLRKEDSKFFDPPLPKSVEQDHQCPTSDSGNLDALTGETLKGFDGGVSGIPISGSRKSSPSRSFQTEDEASNFYQTPSLRERKKWAWLVRSSPKSFTKQSTLSKRKFKNDDDPNQLTSSKKVKTYEGIPPDNFEASQHGLSSIPLSAEAVAQPCRSL